MFDQTTKISYNEESFKKVMAEKVNNEIPVPSPYWQATQMPDGNMLFYRWTPEKGREFLIQKNGEEVYRQPDQAAYDFIKGNFKRDDGSDPEWMDEGGEVLTNPIFGDVLELDDENKRYLHALREAVSHRVNALIPVSLPISLRLRQRPAADVNELGEVLNEGEKGQESEKIRELHNLFLKLAELNARMLELLKKAQENGVIVESEIDKLISKVKKGERKVRDILDKMEAHPEEIEGEIPAFKQAISDLEIAVGELERETRKPKAPIDQPNDQAREEEEGEEEEGEEEEEEEPKSWYERFKSWLGGKKENFKQFLRDEDPGLSEEEEQVWKNRRSWLGNKIDSAWSKTKEVGSSAWGKAKETVGKVRESVKTNWEAGAFGKWLRGEGMEDHPLNQAERRVLSGLGAAWPYARNTLVIGAGVGAVGALATATYAARFGLETSGVVIQSGINAASRLGFGAWNGLKYGWEKPAPEYPYPDSWMPARTASWGWSGLKEGAAQGWNLIDKPAENAGFFSRWSRRIARPLIGGPTALIGGLAKGLYGAGSGLVSPLKAPMAYVARAARPVTTLGYGLAGFGTGAGQSLILDGIGFRWRGAPRPTYTFSAERPNPEIERDGFMWPYWKDYGALRMPVAWHRALNWGPLGLLIPDVFGASTSGQMPETSSSPQTEEPVAEGTSTADRLVNAAGVVVAGVAGAQAINQNRREGRNVLNGTIDEVADFLEKVLAMMGLNTSPGAKLLPDILRTIHMRLGGDTPSTGSGSPEATA